MDDRSIDYCLGKGRRVAAMATRRESKRNLRKLTAMGKYTRYVTIPKGLLRELRWRRGQKLVVTRSGDKLIIEDWKPR